VEASREHPSIEERNRATNRQDDLADRLRLLRTPGIGPVTYRQLIARFGTATAALEAVPDLARRGGGKPPALRTRQDAEREIAAVERLGARFLALGQGLYPRLLAELEDAPPLLIARGNLSLLDRQSVAIVGARNASAAACRFARGLAHDLGRNELVVVSGLARGIDSAAHDGALESGTVGVIAGGIDIFYPPENEARQKAMYERGLVLAEMPPGTEPRARHFPYRNRIIAGMSSGTVVVEAAPRSGSLITARLAAEAGREVMAVPGSPLDPRAQGCNQLIRDGATLVQNAADVMEAIRPYAAQVRSPPAPFEPAPEPFDGDDTLRGRGAARPVSGSGRRDHPVDRSCAGRGADGAPRARPRRTARSSRGEQGEPSRRLTAGIPRPHVHAYA
jgi:DNA processing protein